MRALDRRLARLQSPIERAFPWHKPVAAWSEQQRESCCRNDMLERLSVDQLQWLIKSLAELLQLNHD